jgi:hypothetical protein
VSIENDQKSSPMMWDVFISHASEDKATIARPLRDRLTAAGLRVWLDEAELKLGDSLRAKIDQGLAQSRYGVVILSPAFFAKDWPQRELNGLAGRESIQEKVLLPVWHGIDRAFVASRSPILADKLAVSSDRGLDCVASEILNVIRPDTSSNAVEDHPPNSVSDDRDLKKYNSVAMSTAATRNVDLDQGGLRRRYLTIASLVILAAAVVLGLHFLWPSRGPGQPAPRPRTLTYYFEARSPKSRDWIRYKQELIAPAGYWLRFHFSSPEPGHLYLFNEGPVPRRGMASFNTLFPSVLANQGSSLLNANQELQFPSGSGIRLDEQEGTEKLYIAWSGREISQLEALKKWADPNQKLPNAVESADDVAAIQDFLKSHPLATAHADEENKRTVLIQAADPLVYMVRLEHQ